MPVSAIELHNISFFYNSDPILTDVNLSVEEQDFLAIIGPNGSGKTTLLKIIMGILNPAQGTVRVSARRPWEPPDCLGMSRRIRGLTRISLFPFRMLRSWAGSAAEDVTAYTLPKTGPLQDGYWNKLECGSTGTGQSASSPAARDSGC